eukprot:3989908-Ditylum_brightwellii.AAC.1
MLSHTGQSKSQQASGFLPLTMQYICMIIYPSKDTGLHPSNNLHRPLCLIPSSKGQMSGAAWSTSYNPASTKGKRFLSDCHNTTVNSFLASLLCIQHGLSLFAICKWGVKFL